jgi:hypothetical protein
MAGTDALSLQTYRENVAAILRAVTPAIGQVESRRGALPAWAPNGQDQPALWEVYVASVLETAHLIGPSGREMLTIRTEGFKPVNYEFRSEDVWDALTKSVRDTLRHNPTLKVGGVSIATSSLAGGAATALPQMVTNDVVWLDTGIKDLGAVRCHHAVIDVMVDRIFSWTNV